MSDNPSTLTDREKRILDLASEVASGFVEVMTKVEPVKRNWWSPSKEEMEEMMRDQTASGE